MLIFGSGYVEVTYNFASPTLAQERDKVARALRDPDGVTFTATHLNDYIASAIVEVGRVYPKEVIESFDLVNAEYRYPTQLDGIFRVERTRDDLVVGEIDASDGENSNWGWDLFAGSIHLPRRLTIDEDHDGLRLWGYARRNAVQRDTDHLDVDAEAEQGVIQFATLMGYQALVSDRARFAQWNAIPQNTDVTMPQIQAMVQQAQARWEDLRNRLRRLRRAG